LAKFCDSKDISQSTCRNARNYSYGRVCPVELLPDRRYTGRFIASGNPLLIASYTSDCEPHANNWGGAVVFEKTANDVVFRGYRPGRGSGECVSISKNEKQDRLICITGFLGQGHLESSVIEWIFTRDFSKNIQLAQDSFVSATDSAGAY